jgi:ADP-ribose pyrophosphatase YjhB (NUDIX family)
MVMSLHLRSAVRALIIDQHDDVLLVRFVFPSGVEAWALPGGGLDDGESPDDGLRRELHEELGLDTVPIGPHIWSREHIIPMVTGHDGQRDRIHLVHLERFDPRPAIGWERLRAEFVHEMRWWSLPEIEAATTTRFAPARLGELLRAVLTDGPPVVPIETGV